MLRRALRPLWDEPSVPAPPGTPWWDLALVAVLVPLALVEGAVRPDVPWRATTTALSLVCVLALLARRTHPLPALVVAIGAQTLAGMLPTVAGDGEGVLYVTACLLLFPYSLARWGSGRQVVAGVGFLLACHFLREPLYGNPPADIVVGAGFLLFPAALGAAVRFRNAGRRRAVEQARMRERERLARELHDTVAHHVSGIVLQAQGGRAIATTDPDRAVAVLATIEEAASRALAEMRSIVGLLRQGDDAELAPSPRAVDLERLAQESAGPVPVEVHLSGDLHHLGSSVDAAVYRLVQESVTNAQRHARHASRVAVRVAGEPDAVHVSVTDDGRGAPADADAGFGLVGMAERVELLGGTFAAAPGPHGGWQVQAVLPVPPIPS